MVYGIETPISRVVLEGPTETVELNEIDDTLAVPLIMNYQMSAMEDSAVKEHVAKPTGADAGTLEKTPYFP